MEKSFVFCSLFFFLFSNTLLAQTTGNCETGKAEQYLDINNVRARIFNTGGLFWNGDPHVYEVPKGSSRMAIFTAGIWIGGFVNDTLKVAGARYGGWEFWPGPLDENGNLPTDCNTYDRIYKISKQDIEHYNATGEIINTDLAEWPQELGAPVIDGDGNETNYDLKGGDRPALLGDQMLWWVMNDVGNVHRSTLTPPIGIEVHVSAFAFHTQNISYSSTTFYQYKIIYKGKDTFNDVRFGIWNDADMGDPFDDYVGCDTTLELGYFYNGEDTDGVYGIPPAIGIQFLRGPYYDFDQDGENELMSVFLEIGKGGGVFPDPGGIEYYNRMKAVGNDGQHLTLGENGQNPNNPKTNYAFSGEPGEFWSMDNSDGKGTKLAPSDKRFVMSSLPFSMQPLQETTISFAITWAQGVDRIDSVKRLKSATQILKQEFTPLPLSNEYSRGNAHRPPYEKPFIDAPEDDAFLQQNYPNPVNNTTTIPIWLPEESPVTLKVFNLLGHEVITQNHGILSQGNHTLSLELNDVPNGIYIYQLETSRYRARKKLIVQRINTRNMQHRAGN